MLKGRNYTFHCTERVNSRNACCCVVEGILSALETRCVVTGSPAPVVSAVTLGGKLRSLLSADSVAQTHSVLTDESRVRVIMYIHTTV